MHYCFEPAAFSGRYAMSGNHNHLIQQRSKRLPPEKARLAVNPPRPFEKLVETTTRGNQTNAACFTLQIFWTCHCVSSSLPKPTHDLFLHYLLQLEIDLVWWFCRKSLFFSLLSLPVVFVSALDATEQLCMESLKVPGEGVNTAPGGVYLTPLWPLTKPD